MEEQLLQIMSDEFDADIEDGSAENVAKDIVKLWSLLSSADVTQTVEEWEAAARKAKGRSIPVEIKDETEEIEDDDSEGEEDGEEAPSLLQPHNEKAARSQWLMRRVSPSLKRLGGHIGETVGSVRRSCSLLCSR